MSVIRAVFLVSSALVLLIFSSPSTAQSFKPVGGLDCNGYSKVQKPLRPQDVCADFRSEYGQRGYDNGHYVGHDEPSAGFISTVSHSGNNLQWEITLPRERPLPATQSFENFVAFWFAMALCDPNSGFVRGPCIPDSDENNPNTAGSAFLEMQFYPPGNPPFITPISCDLTHWCASLHINSLETMDNGKLNPDCTETTNFAFIQGDRIPTGPPGPNNLNAASVTPNSQTLLMNQGDRLRITIKGVPGDFSGGVLTLIEDLSTGQSGEGARSSSAISGAPASITLAKMRSMARRTCIGSSARTAVVRGAIRAFCDRVTRIDANTKLRAVFIARS
jgi:hypothetical protein